jgi:hypothetical protein
MWGITDDGDRVMQPDEFTSLTRLEQAIVGYSKNYYQNIVHETQANR